MISSRNKVTINTFPKEGLKVHLKASPLNIYHLSLSQIIQLLHILLSLPLTSMPFPAVFEIHEVNEKQRTKQQRLLCNLQALIFKYDGEIIRVGEGFLRASGPVLQDFPDHARRLLGNLKLNIFRAAYSLAETSSPRHPEECLSIVVHHVEGGGTTGWLLFNRTKEFLARS